MQEATTFNNFYDLISFQNLTTVFISMFTLSYGPGLIFNGPSCNLLGQQTGYVNTTLFVNVTAEHEATLE
jgi:hypothetical protein